MFICCVEGSSYGNKGWHWTSLSPHRVYIFSYIFDPNPLQVYKHACYQLCPNWTQSGSLTLTFPVNWESVQLMLFSRYPDNYNVQVNRVLCPQYKSVFQKLMLSLLVWSLAAWFSKIALKAGFYISAHAFDASSCVKHTTLSFIDFWPALFISITL